MTIPAGRPDARGTVIGAMERTPTTREACGTCGEVHERCAAHKKSTGKPCTQWAIPGGKVCRYHGGNAPQVRAAAGRRLDDLRKAGEVGKLLAEFGDAEPRHPIDALLDRHDEADAMVRVLRLAVAALTLKPAGPAPDTAGTGEPDQATATRTAKVAPSLYGPDHSGDGAPHVLVEMLGTWADRHTRIAKVLLDHDVDQRKLRLESARREAVFAAFMAAAEKTFADPDQRRRFGEELARALQSTLSDIGPDALPAEAGAA